MTTTPAQNRAYYARNRELCVERKRLYRERNRKAIRRADRERYAAFKRTTDKIKSSGCIDCGTTEGELHFHHRDPSTKLFKIASAHRRPPAIVQAELDKCVVLCEPCHRARHQQGEL